MAKLIITTFVFFCFCLFCSAQDTSQKNTSQANFSSSVVKNIPLNKQGKYEHCYFWIKKLEQDISLSKLETGFDSFELRVWSGYFFVDTEYLFQLTKATDQWQLKIYAIKLPSDSITPNSLISSKEVDISNPKQKKAISKLLSSGILSLPDMNKVANSVDRADPHTIIVEIATKTNYRLYHYFTPNFLSGSCVEANTLKDIINLLGKAFSFYTFPMDYTKN